MKFAVLCLSVGVASMVGCNPVTGRPTGGSGPMTGPLPDMGATESPDMAYMGPVCQASTVTATPAAAPADIIWIIDNSGSMTEELGYVQQNINSFSQQIAQSGTNYRVIMIANTSYLVVPPPLGGSADFLAVDQDVQSTNSLDLILSTYPQWAFFLRPNAVKHIVIVSDDNSSMSPASFTAQIGALTNPGFPNGFLLHAIVAENLGIGIPPGPCWDKAAEVGTNYLTLQTQTGGVFSSLCQSDWTPVFTALATAVQQASAIPCTFTIPPPPPGETLDFQQVNLEYTPSGGAPQFVPYVTSSANCGATGGWYYDDPANPTKILTCQTTCSTLSADLTGSVSIAFGCATFIP